MTGFIGRREFITFVGGAAAAWPLAARSQQGERMRRVGVLMGVADDSAGHAGPAAFRQRLEQLGWKEGGNIRIDYRCGAGDVDRGKGLAPELIGLEPDLIFAQSTQSVAALRRITRSIPIVFVQVSDPVGRGFVESLSRPGSNATGFTNFEASMGSKWLELLKEIVPTTTHVALMFSPISSPHIASGFYLYAAEKAADQFGIEASAVPVRDPRDVAQAVGALIAKPNSALIVLPDGFNLVQTDLIISLGARSRVPALYPFPSYAARGGLASYGVNPIEQYPRAASGPLRSPPRSEARSCPIFHP